MGSFSLLKYEIYTYFQEKCFSLHLMICLLLQILCDTHLASFLQWAYELEAMLQVQLVWCTLYNPSWWDIWATC